MSKRNVVGLFILLVAVPVRGQDAPLQSGPLPGTVVTDADPGRGGAEGGYSIEPGMTAPKIVQAVEAVYPEDLPVAVETVRCTLSMIVSTEGTPLFIRVAHSAGEELDSAAIYAVRQSKFQAGLREQKPVPIRTMVQVAFTGDHAPAVPEILKPTGRRTVQESGDAVVADDPPRLLNRVYPEFSEEARRKKVNGTVVLSTLVTEHGTPTDVRVLRGLGYGLDEKAVEAISQYKFSPAMKDGKPIAQHVTVEISFRIR